MRPAARRSSSSSRITNNAAVYLLDAWFALLYCISLDYLSSAVAPVAPRPFSRLLQSVVLVFSPASQYISSFAPMNVIGHSLSFSYAAASASAVTAPCIVRLAPRTRALAYVLLRVARFHLPGMWFRIFENYVQRRLFKGNSWRCRGRATGSFEPVPRRIESMGEPAEDPAPCGARWTIFIRIPRCITHATTWQTYGRPANS